MKKIIITIAMTALLLLGGILISRHDSVKYSSVMNRSGVSEEAVILKTNSKKTITSRLKLIANKPHLKGKFHFIKKNNSNFSYFYSQNEKINLPIDSGRNFSKLDFKSNFPFIIIGSNVKNVYKPQSQAYYKQNSNYLSIIGTVNMKGAPNLNKHIFESISPNMSNGARLNDYQVVIDGIHNKNNLNIIKRAFFATSAVPSTNKINNVRLKFIERKSTNYLILGIITILIAILNINLIVPMKYSMTNSRLNGDLRKDYQVGLMFKYVIYNFVAFIISYVIDDVFLLIISKNQLNKFFILNILISFIIGSFIVFTKRIRKND